jgi:hypothetical protein
VEGRGEKGGGGGGQGCLGAEDSEGVDGPRDGRVNKTNLMPNIGQLTSLCYASQSNGFDETMSANGV